MMNVTVILKLFSLIENMKIFKIQTSNPCYQCHGELSHLKLTSGYDMEIEFRCLACKGCESSKIKRNFLVVCDINSAKNIRMLAEQWEYIIEITRLRCFKTR